MEKTFKMQSGPLRISANAQIDREWRFGQNQQMRNTKELGIDHKILEIVPFCDLKNILNKRIYL